VRINFGGGLNLYAEEIMWDHQCAFRHNDQLLPDMHSSATGEKVGVKWHSI